MSSPARKRKEFVCVETDVGGTHELAVMDTLDWKKQVPPSAGLKQEDYNVEHGTEREPSPVHACGLVPSAPQIHPPQRQPQEDK